ncbi:Leucine-rich repeat-containing protein 56 [Phlyctochytrium bullatum]|nr:Leucine-rich repeat-containing protein 56 [Phlyctochytrium bullatum]
MGDDGEPWFVVEGFQRPQGAPRLVGAQRTAFDAVTNILDGFLSESKLKSLTHEDDLDNVKTFEMEVDARQTSLSSLGKLLPNLDKLKLKNGFIASIRDLGVGYNNLTVLWITRCHLTELDGIGSIGSLRELYLSYNEIEDLSSIAMLDALEILDLEGNNISDIEQIEHLALCSSLQSLNLDGNPVSSLYEPGSLEAERSKHYFRLTVKQLVPSLATLDDEPLESGIRREADMEIIPDDFKARLDEVAKSRPPSALARSSAIHFQDDPTDFSSSLTFGTEETIAGNPILFLRSRRVAEQNSLPFSRPSTATKPRSPGSSEEVEAQPSWSAMAVAAVENSSGPIEPYQPSAIVASAVKTAEEPPLPRKREGSRKKTPSRPSTPRTKPKAHHEDQDVNTLSNGDTSSPTDFNPLPHPPPTEPRRPIANKSPRPPLTAPQDDRSHPAPLIHPRFRHQIRRPRPRQEGVISAPPIDKEDADDGPPRLHATEPDAMQGKLLLNARIVAEKSVHPLQRHAAILNVAATTAGSLGRPSPLPPMTNGLRKTELPPLQQVKLASST